MECRLSVRPDFPAVSRIFFLELHKIFRNLHIILKLKYAKSRFVFSRFVDLPVK